MSGVNFKLEKVIAGTIMNNYSDKRYAHQFNAQRTATDFGSVYSVASSSHSINQIGRTTTYDVIGQRNYQTFYDSKKFKF
ncbi:AC55 [Alphabaculovirus altermyunipunctae]|jgi:hypothetical protein|uniref:AC55 n=1 Tax=Mythimna unipuncta nucleopolyhedrovirus TaxID=447897 RepID=A0A346TPI7_9ABAC|nr:AC55 [Mythimna unipuncta nucleopolyhedrovirus]AXU41497.1 AC55 [Mythimna unipuncta nucleopolyhedrovirus]